MITKQTVKNLNETINFIYENERNFIDAFSPKGWAENVTDLIEITFSAEKVKFVCLMDSGASWVYDCKIEEFNEWSQQIEN